MADRADGLAGIDEAIEAAAKAAYERNGDGGWSHGGWDAAGEPMQAIYRSMVAAAFHAAEPFIAARVRDEAVAEERQRIRTELHELAQLLPVEEAQRTSSWLARAFGTSQLAAGSVPVATPTSERKRAGGDDLRSVSRTGQLPGRLPVEIGQTSDTELLRDALQGWIDQRCSAFSADDFDAAGSLLRRVDAVLAVPVATPAEPRDLTYGRIDADIQRAVDELHPADIGSRVAMENTLQARRDAQQRSPETAAEPSAVWDPLHSYERYRLSEGEN